MNTIPSVALLIETSREYARGLLRGIASYHKKHGPWSMYFEPHGLQDSPPEWLKGWKGDGILVRINDQQMADAVIETGIPAVDVRGAFANLDVPFIGVDNRPVSALAFKHLRDCGLRNFAFCGTPRGENRNQDRRCDYFVDLAEQEGFCCSVFTGNGHKHSLIEWESLLEDISEWLKHLPKPVGIMTCHDDRGQQVLDACRRAGYQVPDEVAVIGVDNDPMLCNLCNPPLTSIDVYPSRIGFEAAAQLNKAMSGESLPSDPLLLGPPRGIAARQSTNMLTVEDEEVSLAIKYIRENAVKGIRVNEVLATSKKSPSTLERRIKKALGRTIKAEITRVRISHAKLLLCETDLRVYQVATRTGFNEAKYFCDVFRKKEGLTAIEFRNKFRDHV